MKTGYKIAKVTTVKPSYSWDYGIPDEPNFRYNEGIGPHNVEDQTVMVVEPEYEGESVIYNTNAPYAKVTIHSSLISQLNSNVISLIRTVNFNDFYNTKTNELMFEGTNDILFEHIYTMPGEYEITYTETVLTSSEGLGTYTVTPFRENIKDYMWQWNNLLSGFNIQNSFNREVTWSQAKFQGNHQITWKESKFPCLTSLHGANSIQDSASINISTEQETNIKVFVKVNEIQPRVYLSGNQPENFDERSSPLTVTLTPRYVRSGSFPIQEIIWDLGDNTPIFSKTRNQNLIKEPFVYNHALSGDLRDVRNYDVKHTYKKTKTSNYSFYPTITAVTASTSYKQAAVDGNCASYLVGPVGLNVIDLSVPSTSAERFKLLQSSFENTDKHVILGQIYNEVGIWTIDSNVQTATNYSTIPALLNETWLDNLLWRDNSVWYE